MKYSILGFSQKAVIALQRREEIDGKEVILKLDVDDLLILNVISEMHARKSIKKVIIEDKTFCWINYHTILSDLPILDICKRRLVQRLDKMEKLGLIEKIVEKEKGVGTFTYIRMADGYEDLKYSKDTEKVQNEHSEIKVEDMDNMSHESRMKLYLDCFLKPGYCVPNTLGERKSMMLRSDVDYDRVIRRILRMDYNDFLRTPYWATVSEMVRERDNHKCQECGSTENLNVHHESYLNHGDEIHHLEDLVCLCHECHIKHHFI